MHWAHVMYSDASPPAHCHLGRAFSSLGRKDDALLVWEQGFEHALHQSADLKQLLELEELLKFAKQDRSAGCETHVVESRLSMYVAESRPYSKSDETSKQQNKLSDISNLCSESRNVLGIHSKSGDNFEIHKGISDEGGRSLKLVPESGCHTNEKSSETSKNASKESDKSELCSELRDAPEICCKSGDNFVMDNGRSEKKAERNQKPGILVNETHDILDLPNLVSGSCSGVNNASELSSRLSMIPGNLGDTSEILSKSSNKANMHNEVTDEAKRNKKLCVTRISKTKSISVDFRLSRGIAQVLVTFSSSYFLKMYSWCLHHALDIFILLSCLKDLLYSPCRLMKENMLLPYLFLIR